MIAARTSLLLAVSPLGACTTPAGFGFDEQRTVFNNPHVPPPASSPSAPPTAGRGDGGREADAPY